MRDLNEIFLNKSLIAAVMAWLIAQCLKFLVPLIRENKVDFRSLITTGGFPSSHAAIVTALATSIGLRFGFGSGLFAVSLILASVVISDARGIRQAAAKQAQILNKIVEELYQKQELKMERLKEFLGHTSLEVFSGVLLGILIAILMNA